MTYKVTVLVIGMSSWGCASSHGGPVSVSVAPADESHQVLATVGGVPIVREELQPDLDDRLFAIEEDSAQKKFQMTWILVEDAISARLLTHEAQKRKVSVEQLRKDEIDSQVKTPTAEDVRMIYDLSKDEIGLPFDQVQEPLKNQLLKERQREAEHKLVDSLRDRDDIRYAIPAPPLRRFEVEKGGGASQGPDTAAVTLVEYSDFECPFCSRARPILARLRELYGDRLRIVFRHFPLPQHPNARPAAEASVCAQEQGKFWPYHDQLFEHASALTAEDLTRYAQNVNLDVAAFKACRGSARPKTEVDAEIKSAERLGVRGTPAMFLNGGRVNGVLPVPLMQSLIEAELARHNAMLNGSSK